MADIDVLERRQSMDMACFPIRKNDRVVLYNFTMRLYVLLSEQGLYISPARYFELAGATHASVHIKLLK